MRPVHFKDLDLCRHGHGSLTEHRDNVREVVDVTDHSAGSNPYYEAEKK